MADRSMGGGPAFPNNFDEDGMSLRDWFAGQAMAAFIQSVKYEKIDAGAAEENVQAETFIARCAYDMADAMLAERAKAVSP